MKVSTENEMQRLDGKPIAKVTVACGISITGDLKEDVLRDLEQRAGVKAALFLEPNQGLGANTFQTAGDVVAFVDSSKRMIREFVKRHRAQELLLYYFGPLSGACFLGQQLNAICSTIIVMEDQQAGLCSRISSAVLARFLWRHPTAARSTSPYRPLAPLGMFTGHTVRAHRPQDRCDFRELFKDA